MPAASSASRPWQAVTPEPHMQIGARPGAAPVRECQSSASLAGRTEAAVRPRGSRGYGRLTAPGTWPATASIGSTSPRKRSAPRRSTSVSPSASARSTPSTSSTISGRGRGDERRRGRAGALRRSRPAGLRRPRPRSRRRARRPCRGRPSAASTRGARQKRRSPRRSRRRACRCRCRAARASPRTQRARAADAVRMSA